MSTINTSLVKKIANDGITSIYVVPHKKVSRKTEDSGNEYLGTDERYWIVALENSLETSEFRNPAQALAYAKILLRKGDGDEVVFVYSNPSGKSVSHSIYSMVEGRVKRTAGENIHLPETGKRRARRIKGQKTRSTTVKPEGGSRKKMRSRLSRKRAATPPKKLSLD